MAKRDKGKRNKSTQAAAKSGKKRQSKKPPTPSEIVRLFSDLLRDPKCIDERALARLRRDTAPPKLTERGEQRIQTYAETHGVKPQKLVNPIRRLLLHHYGRIDADIPVPESKALPPELADAYERDSGLKVHARENSRPTKQYEVDHQLNLPELSKIRNAVGKRDASYVSVHDYLLSLETTEVPPYQREYVWSKANIESLFGDLDQVQGWDSGDGPFHFLGTVLVKDKGDSVYQILDGQQRTTTFCLFVAVAARLLRKWGSWEYAHHLVTQYLGVQKGNELRPKFIPNPSDQGEYWCVLRQAIDCRVEANWVFPKSPDNDPSERSKVRRAAKLIEDKLSWNASDHDSEKRKRLVLDYLHKLLYRCAICRFKLHPTDDGLATFRTLNTRGEALENFDILKSVACKLSGPLDGQSEFVTNSWDPTIRDIRLGTDDPKRIDMFFSAYAKWTLEEPGTKAEAVDKIADYWDGLGGIDTIMKSVKSAVPLFNAVSSFGSKDRTRIQGEDGLTPEELGWLWVLSTAGVSQEIVPFVMRLLEMRLAKTFKSSDTVGSLRFLASWTVRRGIQMGQSLQGLQKYMLKANRELRKGKNKPLDILLEYLDTADQKLSQFTDEAFETALNEVPLARKRDLARAILYRLDLEDNPYNDGRDRTGHKTRVNDQVEHVCPQSLKGAAYWEEIWDAADHREWVHRLGNIVLLEPPPNQEVGRQPIDEKFVSYRKRSNVQMTIELGESVMKDKRWSIRWQERWGVDLVRDRTADLAVRVVRAFPFPFHERKH